ncbi:MAG: hypothetical protein AAF297_04055 [Planctomycetota bacterium]
MQPDRQTDHQTNTLDKAAHPAPASPPAHSRSGPPANAPKVAAVLSLSALGLLVALVLQAMTPWTPTARAEMTVKADGYAAMSTRASNEEIMWVVDDATQTLFVYGIAPNNREVLFLDRQSLPELFSAARAQAGGG